MAPAQDTPPLILFSGMGADHRIFDDQMVAFPELAVPQWITPADGENLTDYCARFAAIIDPGVPCFVGGASFGGIVALEMMQHLDCLGCFLIGSVRGSQQLPKRIRLLRRFRSGINLVPTGLLQKSAGAASRILDRVGQNHLSRILNQFACADRRILSWSAQQLLQWNSRYQANNIFHIHGQKDPVFPIRKVTPDQTIIGGGHVISMTHGRQVNDFLHKHMESLSNGT